MNTAIIAHVCYLIGSLFFVVGTVSSLWRQL